VSRLKIADLMSSPLVDATAHLDEAVVARYAENLGSLPPVVVFETEDGLLVADGYHRLAAARRAGRKTIAADVRRGSRADALRYAIEVASARRGLPAEELATRIRERYSGGWRS
jgi:ParB-like chromosome segregation protein Spo0J